MTRSRRALFTRFASFMKVGLIAYMHRDEILDQRASARPFYMGMVCLQFALLRVTWQAE